MSRTILLQGEPGSGKSMMACLTALNQPTHALDVDCKIQSAGWAQQAIKAGKLTYWEINEPFDPSKLLPRAKALALMKEAANVEPRGWATLADSIYKLVDDPVSKAAGTWVVDSLTLANEHLKQLLGYAARRPKFTFDQWNGLKMTWMTTFSFIRDLARENNKDLIFTVHERFKEEPGEMTKGVRMERVGEGENASLQKAFVGQMDVKVWASIDGAFGDLIGAQCDEYYWLHVDTDKNKDKPEWKCRVWPDGRRALRTSFMLDKAEWPPDFKQIWK